jgi:hypothetical protein
MTLSLIMRWALRHAGAVTANVMINEAGSRGGRGLA